MMTAVFKVVKDVPRIGTFSGLVEFEKEREETGVL